MSAAATLAGAAPDVVPGWHSINWRKVWRNVRRLQARIVKAVQEGRWGKVQALVYLLTHSFAGRALAILRVTTNAGASTPGVDGESWDTPELKAAAFSRLRRHGYHAQPLRRVYIPKSSDPSKVRPLGIPTLTDRAMQALYLLGLDPIGETTADANSYGFRRQRCCADALDQCHKILRKNHSATWILEGDIRACFDRISHDWLLTHLPMDKVILRSWLQAGYLEKDAFFATTAGSPQGGIISPALANRTLDGLEGLLHARFGGTRRQQQQHKVHLVRYADDFVITGTSKKLLRDEVRPLVAHFLKERGLELSHEKTSITHVEDGFDFLGQNVRRYGTKLLLKPSRKNVRSLLAKIGDVIQHAGGHLTAGQLILRLNPKLRGWALYHRHASSKRAFARVDDVILRKLWRWARRRHRHKSAAWVRAKYFTRPGDGRWTFRGTVTDRDGGKHTVRLLAARSVRIRRHVKVRGDANPYDPSWELYFEERLAAQMASTLTGRGTTRYLWLEQDGKCLVCGQPLTLEEGWHVHHLLWRSHGGTEAVDNRVLLHPNCHRQVHGEGLVVDKAASREGRL
jgi:Retron-type reverse transcriptase